MSNKISRREMLTCGLGAAGLLAVIDGIETNRGGEGFWIRGAEPIQPELLMVGRNAVCTDDPGRIEVAGLPIKEALHPFNPKRLPVPLPRS